MSERATCPECGKSYASLSGLKIHMGRMHGGYTDEQIAAAVTEPIVTPAAEPVVITDDGTVLTPDDVAPPPPPPIPDAAPSEPKRYSKRSRELNDQLNSALQLCIKHLTKGLDDTERQQLDFYRREVTAACIGVEFDFEERLITLHSKIWLLVSVLILYGVEKLPTLAAMFEMLKKPADAKKEKPKDVSATV